MLDLDKLLRSLGFRRAIKTMTHVPTDLFEAYAAGVNAYAEERLLLPIEFYLVGTKFDKWTVDDSLVLGKLMSFETAYRWVLTILRQVVLESAGKDVADLVIPIEMDSGLGNFTTVMNEEEVKQMGIYSPKKQSDPDLSFNGRDYKELGSIWKKEGAKKKNPKDSPTFFAGGSNAWVVHGNYTKSGKPILAGDPHLGTRIPSIWYLCRAKMPGGNNFYGITMAGLPALLMGRTDYAAWGITVSYGENTDVYKLVLNPELTHYYYNSSWTPLKKFEEKIEIKNEKPLLYTALETHHGRVLFPLDKKFIGAPK